MKEIYKNTYFTSDHRLKEVQDVIDLMHDNFPECGLPGPIAVTDQWIVIGSKLGNLSQGYKHGDFDSNMYTIDRVCIYDRNTRKLESITNREYAIAHHT